MVLIHFNVLISSLCIFCFLKKVTSECPPVGDSDETVVKIYDYIDMENYDRNYSSYNNDRRPLGYDKATVYFDKTDHPDPCIKVTNAAGRMFEVMIETVPSTKICVKERKIDEPLCDEGFLRKCNTAVGNTVYVELLCDNCEETDVDMWYRIRMSEVGDNDIENWCSVLETEYPSNLLVGNLPPGKNPFQKKDDGDNGSSYVKVNLNVMVFLVMIVLVKIKFLLE
ncbi:uncharacterized protein LOC126827675 [Patella vulgata]|uniref:uncharacterized protein LOC126827675 n=1 Tax=Patella vulgata TaxID=6465 RepID=UPI0021804004|nr:uncharacterized protein LOC126827675 [Patella vulgata]